MNNTKEVPIGFGENYIEYDVNELKSNATILDDTANNVEWLKVNSGIGDAIFSTGENVTDIGLIGTDNTLDTTETINGKISTEALIRADNDTLLQTNIDLKANQTDLGYEETRRINADTGLQNQIYTKADLTYVDTQDTNLQNDIDTEKILRENADMLLQNQIDLKANQSDLDTEKILRENADNSINDYQIVQDDRIDTNQANITTLGEILATQNNVLELTTQTGIIPEGVEVPINFSTVKNSYPNNFLVVDDTANTIFVSAQLEHQYLNFKVNVGVTSTTKTITIRFYANSTIVGEQIKTIPAGSNELTLELFDITLINQSTYNMTIQSTIGGGTISVISGKIYLEGLTSTANGEVRFSSQIFNDKADLPFNGINPDLIKVDLKVNKQDTGTINIGEINYSIEGFPIFKSKNTTIGNYSQMYITENNIEFTPYDNTNNLLPYNPSSSGSLVDKRYVDNLIETLKLPIGTKLITGVNAAPFSYGVWNLIGKLFENETIIGFSDDSLKGTRTSGDNKSHNHLFHTNDTGNNTNDGGDAKSFDSWNAFDVNGNPAVFNVSDGDNNNDGSMLGAQNMYTNNKGTDKNYAAGLHIGQAYIWERVS